MPWTSKSDYDCKIYLPINLVHWSSSSPSDVFSLTCFDLLPQRASMGCLVWCLRELIELVLSSVIGDDSITTSASTVFKSEHYWALTTPPWSIYSKSHQSLPRAHKIIKRYKKNNTQFNTSTGRELERALWINLIQIDLIFLLMTQEYSPSLKSTPRLQEYTFSLCTYTLLLSFLVF